MSRLLQFQKIRHLNEQHGQDQLPSDNIAKRISSRKIAFFRRKKSSAQSRTENRLRACSRLMSALSATGSLLQGFHGPRRNDVMQEAPAAELQNKNRLRLEDFDAVVAKNEQKVFGAKAQPDLVLDSDPTGISTESDVEKLPTLKSSGSVTLSPPESSRKQFEKVKPDVLEELRLNRYARAREKQVLEQLNKHILELKENEMKDNKSFYRKQDELKEKQQKLQDLLQQKEKQPASAHYRQPTYPGLPYIVGQSTTYNAVQPSAPPYDMEASPGNIGGNNNNSCCSYYPVYYPVHVKPSSSSSSSSSSAKCTAHGCIWIWVIITAAGIVTVASIAGMILHRRRSKKKPPRLSTAPSIVINRSQQQQFTGPPKQMMTNGALPEGPHEFGIVGFVPVI